MNSIEKRAEGRCRCEYGEDSAERLPAHRAIQVREEQTQNREQSGEGKRNVHLGQTSRKQAGKRREQASTKGNDCNLNYESETDLLDEKQPMEQVRIGLIGADSR